MPSEGAGARFWQHQFWARFVRHGREFQEHLECMHLNPLRKGRVKRPEDWRWSSYNNYSLGHATVVARPIQIDDVRLLLGLWA